MKATLAAVLSLAAALAGQQFHGGPVTDETAAGCTPWVRYGPAPRAPRLFASGFSQGIVEVSVTAWPESTPPVYLLQVFAATRAHLPAAELLHGCEWVVYPDFVWYLPVVAPSPDDRFPLFRLPGNVGGLRFWLQAGIVTIDGRLACTQALRVDL